jgi:hypothetical protein
MCGNSPQQEGPTFITGDFNCPNTDWSSIVAHSENLNIFFNFIITNSFVQVTDQPTHLNNTLDLLCVNEPLLLSKFCTGPPLSDSDHDSIYFDIMTPETEPTDSDVPTLRYLWNEADYASMSQFLINFNWKGLISSNFNTEDLWMAFYEVIDHAISLYVPTLTLSRR